ncbi:MAG: teichoic acid biosynthesis protein [Candidatus Thermoplasmatota archaeon]|nr:teichoic acid biosynthesis protein [Euryarchaeota archaeon]MBU4032347.1 teichoic acid biosynthesis protein [Candidatus Thermoplasmatota archaeon]MBU4071750.1 teichoic acid biosynthesis protein [Candidatus Thermoplasmatota archaeon]MBU4144844.1 teichoic acid biosynthesis protein [Candidatus Thermoplasmatota archaeon]MBU4592157.1 teichoic acid biosynthesis protein [Candidatus Thermoplasmatota archaeon]
MNILYGVVGEGLGHAMRSHVVIEHLEKQGHEVKIVTSGKAHEFLRKNHRNIDEIGGYGFAFNESGVDLDASLRKLLNEIPTKAPHNLKRFFRLSKSFKPNVIISDFESFAYLFGKYNHIPVISIDNMQVINRCRLDVDIPLKIMDDYLMAKGLVKAKLPGCYHYLVTSYFFPEITKQNTTLHHPILRKEVLAARPENRGHVLVYQTSKSNPDLLRILDQVDEKFIVYGFGRDEILGNVTLKNFSNEGFVSDLASCKAVIANAGFSLIGEALHLGKPYLAIPLERQFEQMLNAMYLKKLGYGDYCSKLDAKNAGTFLGQLDLYSENLEKYTGNGNWELLSHLDDLLKEIA